MDVLNRWVRTSGACRPRKAVYWLKSRYAIRDAVMAGMVPTMRVVIATVKCNRCRDGQYIDWEGNPRGQCYKCKNGIAKLLFVETSIAGRWKWHTPLDYTSWLGWPIGDLVPEPVTDWTPGREGVELSIDEGARHLNVVEEYWPQWKSEKPYSMSRDEYDSTHYYLFKYSLDLGTIGDPDVCFLCGTAAEYCCSTVCAPGLETRWPTCRPCGERKDVWDIIHGKPLPELSPSVNEWRERHLQQFANEWKGAWFPDRDEWQTNRRRRLEVSSAT